MKMYDLGITLVIGLVVGAFGVGFLSNHFFGPDNAIEEISEQVIKEETGLDLDLTPCSKEVVEEK